MGGGVPSISLSTHPLIFKWNSPKHIPYPTGLSGSPNVILVDHYIKLNGLRTMILKFFYGSGFHYTLITFFQPTLSPQSLEVPLLNITRDNELLTPQTMFYFLLCVLGDREELQVNAERLVCRCLTVDVRVSTPRSNSQEEALQATNTFLDGIREQLAANLHEASETLKGLINACSSDQTVHGPVNHKFQALVLACAAEDQKKIRKKLHKWMSSIHAAAKGLS